MTLVVHGPLFPSTLLVGMTAMSKVPGARHAGQRPASTVSTNPMLLKWAGRPRSLAKSMRSKPNVAIPKADVHAHPSVAAMLFRPVPNGGVETTPRRAAARAVAAGAP